MPSPHSPRAADMSLLSATEALQRKAYEKAIDKNRFAKLLKTPPDALQ